MVLGTTLLNSNVTLTYKRRRRIRSYYMVSHSFFSLELFEYGACKKFDNLF